MAAGEVIRPAGGTAAQWAADDPVLKLRELGIETDTRKMKVGDGSTPWSGLDYLVGAVSWGGIGGTLSAQTDLQTALNAKEPTIAAGTTAQYWRGDKSWQTLDKAAVGLGNLSNTVTGSLGSVVLSSSPTIATPGITTSLTVTSAATASAFFSAGGGAVSGQYSLDSGGNMVFRQNTSGSIFFDFIGATNFRNSSLTNVCAISSTGVVSVLGGLTPKTNDGAAIGTGALGFSDLFLASGAVINFANGNATLTHSSGKIASSVPVQFPSYTVGTVPAATLGAGSTIYVSNESGGAVLAFSDGTDWRRVTDRAVIS